MVNRSIINSRLIVSSSSNCLLRPCPTSSSSLRINRLNSQSSTSTRFNSTSTSSSSTPPTEPRKSKNLFNAILLGLFGASTYVLGSIYPPSILSLAFPSPAPPRLSADSEEGQKHTKQIEDQLLQLPIVKNLLSISSLPSVNSKNVGDFPGSNPSTKAPSLSIDPSQKDKDGHLPHYIISRPYVNYPPQQKQHSLTAGSLRGPGLIATYPLVLSKTSHGAEKECGHEGDALVIVHLGRSLCGHDGVVHGGLLATIVDEALARTAFYSLPAHIGMTANLNIDYKKPVMADQFVVIKTWKVDSKDRKCNVQCEVLPMIQRVEELEEVKPMLKAKALFVQPKFAEFLNTKAIKAALDSP